MSTRDKDRTMSSYIAGLYLICVLSFTAIHSAEGACTGRERNGVCYEMQTGQETWDTANQTCRSKGLILAIIKDQATNDFVATYMQDSGVTFLWAGARESFVDWSWGDDGSAVFQQGCYMEWPSKKDLDGSQSTTYNYTADTCMAHCKRKGFKFAGTMSGGLCNCGDTYGHYGPQDNCRLSCRVDTNLYCGGWFSNFVYNVNGVFSAFAPGRPDNEGGYQACAALDSNFDYQFNDMHCSTQYNYICQLPTTTSLCPTSIGGRCYYISSSKATWFKAREDCWGRSGDLAHIATDAEWKALKAALPSPAGQATYAYYIGLANSAWTWTTGERVQWTNFAAQQPSHRGHNCLGLNQSAAYAWSDDRCAETHRYMCQTEPPTTTAQPTTTPLTTTAPPAQTTTTISSPAQTTTTTSSPAQITTAPDTTTTPQTTTPASTIVATTPPVSTSTAAQNTSTAKASGGNNTGGGPTPDAGASTDVASGLSTWHIVLIIVCAVLLLAIVLFVLLFVYYKRANSHGRVNSYDARPEAPVPNAGNNTTDGAEYEEFDNNADTDFGSERDIII